jgi:hypothetical protein
MGSYRIYFREESGWICGREDFEAPDNGTALCVAQIVFDACSDRAAQFNLWSGTEAVRDVRPPPQMLRDVIEKRQANIAELEERIRDSTWNVATSQELLRRLDGMRRNNPDDRGSAAST